MKKDMCTIILDDCNDSSVRFSEINKEDAIFAYKNGVLRDSMGGDTFYSKIQPHLDGLIELCEGIQDINEWVK